MAVKQLIWITAITASLSFQSIFAREASNLQIPEEIMPIQAPFRMPQLKRPQFPDRTFDIRDYGAVQCKWDADKQQKSTDAIGKAIEACHQAGGGKVLIPAGDWITGAIHLKSHVNLYIAEGAVVHFSNDLKDYLPMVHIRSEGVECYNYSPLIYAPHTENIAITGKGTFHGHGRWWWSWFKKNYRMDRSKASKVALKDRPFGKGAGLEGMRPSFIMPWKSKNILIEGITLIESPMWNVHPVYSENIIVRGITIHSLDSPNGDGINPDSCKNVLIEYNHLQTGDDAVTIKSGLNEDGLNIGIPCENIVVRNFVARDVRTGSGGIVFGSETSGGIRNVYVHNALFEGCDRGIRFKTARGRGNVVENIYIRDVQMNDIKYSAININSYYERNAMGKSPLFRNMVIRDIQVDGARIAIEVTGLPEKWIENINIKDAVFKNVDGGADFHRVKELSLENVTIDSKGRPIDLEDVFAVSIKNVELNGEKQVPPIQIRGSESGAITIEGLAPEQVECSSEIRKNGIKISDGLGRAPWSKQGVAGFRKDLAKQERLESQLTSNISIEDSADLLEFSDSAVGLIAAKSARGTLKGQTCQLKTQTDNQRTGVSLEVNGQVLLTSPPEGLWSVATGWEDDWPTDWVHGSPEMIEQQGPWLVMNGSVGTDEGDWKIRDAYIAEGRLIRGVRRWTWTGKRPAKKVSLSVRFQSPDSGAAIFMPGICYYGNPADKPPRVAKFSGKPGEELLCEEHRFGMPFASLEWDLNQQCYGVALHTMPSLTPFANVADQWWSLGGIGRDNATELTLLSGPCSLNGQRSFVKANQDRSLKYPDMWMDVPPGAVIEKTFYLEAYPVAAKGKGFQHSIRSSVELFHPYSTDGMPTFDEIIEGKYRFTVSRWHEDTESAGIRKYPHNNDYVMGWAGQSDAPGYALLALSERLGDPKAMEMAQRLMDHLTTSPFNEDGFMVRYNPDKNQWHSQDPISQGQAMESLGRAILIGQTMDKIDTSKWEAFLKKACDIHAARILDSAWRPRSTNQGFLVSPLCKAYRLFGNEVYKRAATKATEHYAARHLDMTEPYWGGTLDARCEDKEGAWAGFQAFLAMYEMTKEKKYLDWAEHAMDVTLSYTVVWDIDMPPGRLRDHNFKSRGWTVVSAQNQHLDVYGVLYTPEIYRMGQYLGREDLKKLAIVMYRSCGQLIDPFGSQGEQIQHTNFSQRGNMDDVTRMRGGYSEGWTVYWITAHFLNAAAQFQEMGLLK